MGGFISDILLGLGAYMVTHYSLGTWTVRDPIRIAIAVGVAVLAVVFDASFKRVV